MELIFSLLLSFGIILVLQDDTNAAKYSMSEASNLLLKAQLCQNIPEIDVPGHPLSGTPPFKTSVFLVQGSNNGHVLAAEINATQGFTFNLMVVQALNQNGIPSGHFIHYPCRDPRENRGRHYIESYCSRQGQNDEISQKWGTTRLMYSLPNKNRKQEFLTSDGIFWLWLPNPPNTHDMLSLKDGNSPPKQIQFVFTVARTFNNGTSQYYTDIRTPVIEFHHSFEPIETIDEFGSEQCYANPLNTNQSAHIVIQESQFKIPINTEYWNSIVEKGNTTEPTVPGSTPTTTEESTETGPTETTGSKSATTNVPEVLTTPTLETTTVPITEPDATNASMSTLPGDQSFITESIPSTEECTDTTESESTTPTLEVTTTEEGTDTTESTSTTPTLEVTSTTEECTDTTESESTTPTLEVTSTTEACADTTESESTTPTLEVTSTIEECTDTTESESTTPTLEVTSTTEEYTDTTESESTAPTLGVTSTTEECTDTTESTSTTPTLGVTSTTEECADTTESTSTTPTLGVTSTTEECADTTESESTTPTLEVTSTTEECTDTTESTSTTPILGSTSTVVTESVITAVSTSSQPVVSESISSTTEECTETTGLESTTKKIPEIESTPTLESTTGVTESVVTRVSQTSQTAFTEPSTDVSKPRPTSTSVPLPDYPTDISQVKFDVEAEVEIIEEWEEELYCEVEIEVVEVEPIVALFYEGCKTRKGCLEDRPGCVQDMNCKAMVSFSKWHDNHPDYFHFELIGIHDGTQGYVAVGFSLDQYMGEDSVIECIANSDGTVGVFESWNEKNHQNTRLEGSSCGTTNFSSTHTCNVYVVNGALYCEFFKRSKTVIRGKVFDLDEGSFHILRAYGGALQDITSTEENWEVEIEKTVEIGLRRKRSIENAKSTKEADPKSDRRQATTSREPYKTVSESRSQINPKRKLGKHKKHFATTRSINLAEDIELDHDLRPHVFYTKIHGIFMVVSWIVFIPNAHFIVRYFQESWIDVTYFGRAYWFFVHLMLVILAGSFCCIATVSSILNLILGKKRWPSGDEEIIHSVLGSISLLLLVVQFVTGIIRHKKPKWKKPLDIIHLISGVTSYLIAASLIASAHTIPFTYIPCSSFLLIIVWVIWSILMHIVISVQICQKQKQAKNKMPPTIAPSPSQAQLAQQSHEMKGARFRLVVFAFHAAGAAIVGTLLTLPYIFSVTGCDCLFCFTI